jgi:hypothetical protein
MYFLLLIRVELADYIDMNVMCRVPFLPCAALHHVPFCAVCHFVLVPLFACVIFVPCAILLVCHFGLVPFSDVPF